MNTFLYFILSLIIIFLSRLLVTFITVCLSKRKLILSEVFDYKAELVNALVLALFFLLVGEFLKYYNFSTLINYLIVLLFLSLLLIYHFLAPTSKSADTKRKVYNSYRARRDTQRRRDKLSYTHCEREL